jgi:Tol biopolymer transport system component
MKQRIFSVILSIFILIVIGCDKDKSPTAPDKIKFPKQLTSSGKDFVGFWSPDGQYIAFLSARNTYDPHLAAIITELWIMKSDGSEENPIISLDDLAGGNISMSCGISWSRDSQYMLVSIQNFKRSEIWRVTIEGNITKLSLTDESTERPKYSPDGSRIAYLIQEPNPPQESPVYRLYVSNAEFLEPILVDSGLISDYAWNSNSCELIYSLYDKPNENFEIWKSSLSGNEKLQLTNTIDSEIESCYSNDGNYIAYSSRNTVYVTPSDTFQSKRVLNNARLPKWIPNSNLLLITSVQTTDSTSFWTNCLIIDLDGKIIQEISNNSSTPINFSPNGEYFIYSADGNLWIDKLQM